MRSKPYPNDAPYSMSHSETDVRREETRCDSKRFLLADEFKGNIKRRNTGACHFSPFILFMFFILVPLATGQPIFTNTNTKLTQYCGLWICLQGTININELTCSQQSRSIILPITTIIKHNEFQSFVTINSSPVTMQPSYGGSVSTIQIRQASPQLRHG